MFPLSSIFDIFNTDIRSSQVTYVRESAAKCSFVQNKQTQTKWERGLVNGERCEVVVSWLPLREVAVGGLLPSACL